MKNASRGLALARRTGVGALSTALVTATLLIANQAPANAAAITVHPGDLRDNATPYAGWHQGYADGKLNAAITENGLSLRGKSQVINGYANNDNAGLATGGVNANLTSLIGATYNVVSGAAYFQVPLFVDTDNNDATPGVFTTLRPVAANTGNTPIAGTDAWTSSQNFGTIVKNEPTTLNALIAAVNAHKSKTIAFGVLTDIGASATVESITFNNDTYTFDAAPVVSSTVTNDDIRPEETTATYSEWHQGYASAAGRHQVTSDGLVLAGRSQVIKGFSNNSDTLNAVNANLQFVLPEAEYTVAAGSDPVYLQVPIKFNNGDGLKFTTLRNTGQGPGTHGVALSDQWQSSRALGAIPANTNAPLGDLIAALGDYKTIAVGVLTNTGDVGTVSKLDFGTRSYTFSDAPDAPTATEVVPVSSIASDASTYAGWHQGAPGGTATAATDSNVLDLGANKSQVIKGYPNNSNTLDARNVNLIDALTNASYTVSSGSVYFQVPLFLEDPTSGATVFTTLRPATEAAVGTNRIDVGDEWVSSRAIGDFAANTPYLLGDLLSGIKTYKVLAFGVFSDTGGNGKVTDITWAGTRYTFTGNRSPVTPNRSATTTAGKAVTVNLAATDADGDTLTYTVTPNSIGGPISLTGNALKYTPATGYAGTKTVKYQANDGRGGASEGTVTIKVNPAKTTLTLNSFTGGAKNTFIRVTPKAPGGVVNGATVDIRKGGKAIKSGKVANGFVRLQVGSKIKKGTYTYYVYYRGTPTSAPVTKAIVVKIK